MDRIIRIPQTDTKPTKEGHAYAELMANLEAQIASCDWDQENSFDITYGGKLLGITVSPTGNFAFTRVENVAVKPENGSTTFLYKLAKELIQKITNRLKREIAYSITTNNEQMKAWAETTGNEIFLWDTMTDEPEAIRRYQFTKKFIPEKHE